MKVILYMAISADGFIATKDGNSDWVSDVDVPIFEKKVKEFGCIVLGRKTFNQFYGELYPFKGVLNIVVTSEVSRQEENTVFVNSPKEALVVAENKGFNKVLLIGGGTINGSFLKANLIGEIYLDTHPLILGKGIKLFEGCGDEIRLKLLELNELEKGQILLHYKVIN